MNKLECGLVGQLQINFTRNGYVQYLEKFEKNIIGDYYEKNYIYIYAIDGNSNGWV